MDCRDLDLSFAYPSDAQALALMSRDLIEAGLGWSYRKERMTRFIADPDAVTLVARYCRQRVGFAIMTFGEQRAHLILMAVYPAFQRHGIGTKMIEWLLASAIVAGIRSVDVELRADNRRAYALYRKQGFDETSRIAGYYGGQETAVRMLRVLRPSAVPALPWRPPTHDKR
jgi:ribosomal-protein-alanine N-acetyltransferase